MSKSLRLAAATAALVSAAPVVAQTAAPKAECRLAWDTQFLYASFQVDDADVRAGVRDVSPRSFPGILQDDGIGVSVQVGENKPAVLLVSAAGGFAYLKDAVASPLFTVKFGTDVKGTINRSGDRDRGFTVEVALPWQALGVDGATVTAQTALRACLSVRLRGVSQPFAFPAGAAPDDPKSWQALSLTGAGAFAAARATAAPSIDGVPKPGEWPASPFSFEIAPATEAPIATATLPLPTVGEAGDEEAPLLKLDAPFSPERRVFARYLPNLNADLVKPSAPQRGILASDGSIQLVDQPAQGLGPWYSSDRVAWHRNELMGMARAGIDTALTVVGSPTAPAGALDAKALTVLVAAKRELSRERLASPDLALSLDTATFPNRLDLATDAGRDALYFAIARWFEIVPPEMRAAVRLPADNATGAALAYPVYLSDGTALTHADDSRWADAIRTRFAQRFGPAAGGATLVFLGGPGFGATQPGFAAVLPTATGAGVGAVKSFVLQPGSQNPFVPRRFGETFRAAWDSARASAAEWLILDSWNDFGHATDIAPSRQYGDGYGGLTRLALSAGVPKGAPAYAVRFGAIDAPRRLRPSQLVSVSVQLRNAGEKPLLATDNVTLNYRWLRAGAVVAEGPLRISLKEPAAPGQRTTLKIGVASVATASQPLTAGVYQLQLVATHPGGTETVAVPVTIGDAETVAFDGTTLSPLLLTGATYPVRVKLRYTGPETLVPGSAQLMWQVLAPGGTTALASGTTPLDRPIAPGSWVSVPANVTLIDANDRPIEPAFPERQVEAGTTPLKWGYRVVWSLVRSGASAPVPGSYEERVAVYPGEDEARLTVSNPPAGGTVTADRAFTIPVVIANTGSNRWPKGKIALTGRWFQADGFPLPVLSALPNTSIPKELAPGEAVTVDVVVRAPDRAGRFVLGIFALRPPDGFLSLHPITRTSDTAFVPLHVTGGRLTHLDLTGQFDTDAVASEGKPRDGALEPGGATLPAEWFPADRFGLNQAENVYPSAYYSDLSSDIVRGTTFRFGPTDDGKKNALSCQGQTLTAPRGKYVALHFAAAAIGGKARELTVILRYKDGKSETITRSVRDWQAPVRVDEALSLRFPRRRGPAGDTGETAAVQHVILPLRAAAELTAIVLPKDPQIKLFAATLEQ